jgi:beta-lactam-binding protein with PASTA domain
VLPIGAADTTVDLRERGRRRRGDGPFDQDELTTSPPAGHDDTTFVGVPAASPATVPPATVDPDPTIVGPREAATDLPYGDDGRTPSRRRWLLVAILAIVIAVGAAAAVWAVAKAATPSHPVPAVVGGDRAAAVRQLRALDFKVREDHARRDGTTPGQVIDQQPARGASLKEGKAVTITVSDGNELAKVADLTGKPRAEAIAALQRLELQVRESGERSTSVAKGLVLRNTAAGRSLEHGQTVDLVVSEGPPPVALPDVKGLSFDDAKAKLEQAGFEVARGPDDYSDDVQKDQVIRTSPGPAPAVDVGTRVTVVVSKGPKTIVVPNVRGRSVAEAAALLQQIGLAVGGTFGPNPVNGRVVATDPPAGAKVPRGTSVLLYTR